MYNYRAKVLKVVDGDTMHVQVDLGMDQYTNKTVRLHGLNCPEIGTPEGVAAKQFVQSWLLENAVPSSDTGYPQVIISTIKDRREKYGRYLALVFASGESSGLCLNDELVNEGHAQVYLP